MPNSNSIRPIKIAILAMGGEGGGVLADWIVGAAEHEGFYAQSTSVPGVAQRTGATIYYVEILPVQRSTKLEPVFGLMPTPGDVDVVLASELMESARAVQRGLVTPDKTLLVTSSSRSYSLTEKMAMSDGRMDSKNYLDAGMKSARKYVARDFAAIAEGNASVISAPLFGALAASGTLPWSRDAFEAAIKRGGVGVPTSLSAFAAGFDAYSMDADSSDDEVKAPLKDQKPLKAIDPRLAHLEARVRSSFPAPAQDLIIHGMVRTADYQDVAYANQYLDRLMPLLSAQSASSDSQYRLLRETARYLALWMTYEDTARVAELKLRNSRFDRVHREVGKDDFQIVRINEFFHPRLEEITDTLPASFGRWIEASSWASAFIRRFTSSGKVIRTSSLKGFLLLYFVSSFKGSRRNSWRFQREMHEMNRWFELVLSNARTNYDLACEIAECQRLIKGYGETHARGMKSYNTIVNLLPSLPASSAASTVGRLRAAALADESGGKLAEAVSTILASDANLTSRQPMAA